MTDFEFPLYTLSRELEDAIYNIPAVPIANYGDAESNRRQDWLDLLLAVNTLISDVNDHYTSLQTSDQEDIYPSLNSRVNNDGFGFNVTDWLDEDFVLLPRGDARRLVYFSAQESNAGSLFSLIEIYNAFYQNRPERSRALYTFPNEKAKGGNQAYIEAFRQAVEIEYELRVNLAANLAGYEEGDEEAAEALGIEGLLPMQLQRDDINFLSGRPEFVRTMSSTFNKDIIAFIPIIENFYLTNKYFGQIGGAFENTKDQALGILLNSIRDQDSFDSTPDMSRLASQGAIATVNGPDMDSIFKEFIINTLFELPVTILKSIANLIDPHVIITRIIKQESKEVFKIMAAAMDEPAGEIREGLTGEDLTTLLLCIIDQGLGAAGTALTDVVPMPPGVSEEDFFPRISYRDGVDFTGTVSGMLVAPPTPFGLLYLLLELLKNMALDSIENVEDAAENAATETECNDNETTAADNGDDER